MASPIEVTMYQALRASAPEDCILYCSEPDEYRFDPMTKAIVPVNPDAVSDMDEIGAPDLDFRIVLYRGVAIATYRADIVIELDHWRRLVVECDGHDFHDRTKQQAAYDRARDRELLMLGFVTIRFTGSEIVHAPERCASETWRCLSALHDVDRIIQQAWSHGWEIGAMRGCEGAILASPEEHW